MRRLFAAALLIALIAAAPLPASAMKPPARRTPPPSPTVPAAEAPAPAADQTSGDEPRVLVKPARSYTAKKIVLFPLEIPGYVLRVATFPIGIAGHYIERKRVVEHVVDFLSNKEKTRWVYPIIEGGAGSGFGGGIGFTDTDLFGEGLNMKAFYKNHVNFDQDAYLAFGKPDATRLLGRPISWLSPVSWIRHTSEYFYGVGPGSTQANFSEYLINRTLVGAEISGEVVGALSVALGTGYSIATTGPNTEGSGPPVNQIFAPGVIPGFETWLGYFIPALRVTYDSRDNVSLTEEGGLYTGAFKRFQHLGSGSYDFNQYEIDLRHYFKLGPPRMVVVLHMGWIFQQATGGGAIPFYRLATLDVNSPLRGFNRGRFHDRDLCVFNVEYRFPIWEGLDGVVFGDTGKVFHSVGNFNLDDMKYDGGGGFRFRALNLMLLRVDIAYGGEGIQVLMGISRSL